MRDLDYSLSSLIVILPFLAVFITLRALVITPIPSLVNSDAEIVISFPLFDVSVVFFIFLKQ